jgi:membrane protein involved in colicin uptake
LVVMSGKIDAGRIELFMNGLGRREEAMLRIVSDPETTPEREANAYVQLDKIAVLQGCATFLDIAMQSEIPVAHALGMAIYSYMFKPSEALWARVEFLIGEVTNAAVSLTGEVVRQAREQTAQAEEETAKAKEETARAKEETAQAKEKTAQEAERTRQEAERTSREIELARQEAARTQQELERMKCEAELARAAAARTAQEEARKRQEEQNALQAVEETRRRRALADRDEKMVEVAKLEAQLKLEEVALAKATKVREDAQAAREKAQMEREVAQKKHEEHESLNWFVKIFA